MPALELSKKVGLRIVLIAAMLALLEFAFRYGVWDGIVKPDSYAGTIVGIKKAVESLGPDRVDFITIGDSIAESGISHEQVAATAGKYGFTHAYVGTGGMHWMSIEFMIRWMKEQSPRLQNAVIATNVNSFRFAGNGSYELAIAAPLARPWNTPLMQQSVEFKRDDIRTYGVYSALFQYRDDLRDLVESPIQRVREIRWTRRQGLNNKVIFHTIPIARNVCRVPLASIQTCAKANSTIADDANLINQCRGELPRVAQQVDYRSHDDPTRWPHLIELKKLRQQQLRDLPLKRPIMVVLMPVPKITRESILPIGMHEWVLAVLQPLVTEGVIELHDYTILLDGDGSNGGIECTAFHDLYHLNSVGQKQLTNRLLPILEDHVYRQAFGKTTR